MDYKVRKNLKHTHNFILHTHTHTHTHTHKREKRNADRYPISVP